LILAGDVGGTKILLGLFEAGRPGEAPVRRASRRLFTANVADPVEAIGAWVEAAAAELGGSRPERASLGIAGPVAAGTVRGTNLPWPIEADRLAERLGGIPVDLLNDVEASAHALDVLGPERSRPLLDGVPDPRANRALVSPGTGLGECLVTGRGSDLVAIGSEGGHADFAPNSEEQVELWRFLRSRHGRVSWERVVSGPGIAAVHAWLVSTGRFGGDPGAQIREDDPRAPARIAEGALAGSSALGVETFRLWAEVLGAEAGNVALRANARGGVFLGGGIPAKVLPLLRGDSFREAFRDKPPNRDWMERVPVFVVDDPEMALTGAAVRALVQGA
jgi:glucokinase